MTQNWLVCSLLKLLLVGVPGFDAVDTPDWNKPRGLPRGGVQHQQNIQQYKTHLQVQWIELLDRLKSLLYTVPLFESKTLMLHDCPVFVDRDMW